MRNRLLKKIKNNFKKSKMKNNLLFEMADDFIDMIAKSKMYKKAKKKTKM